MGLPTLSQRRGAFIYLLSLSFTLGLGVGGWFREFDWLFFWFFFQTDNPNLSVDLS